MSGVAPVDKEAFLRFHAGASRQVPGTPEDVAWAVAAAGPWPGAQVLDAGAGDGADIPALRVAIPDARGVAVDACEIFVLAMAEQSGPEVRALHGAMGPVPGLDGSPPVNLVGEGPFDLIWCAGAIHFPGVETALRHWRGALAPDGAERQARLWRAHRDEVGYHAVLAVPS